MANTIHHDIIGVSFLDENQHSKIHDLWSSRFQPDRSTLVQATLQTAPRDLLNQIAGEIQAQGRDLVGLRPILVGYLDFQQEEAQRQAEMLENLNNQLLGVGCSTVLTIQFGFVGELPCENAPALRQRVQAAVEVATGTVCLVGKYGFEEDNGYNWKATVILLDLLRRWPNPMELLPNPGGVAAGSCVCFLRYGEFNQKGLDELDAQIGRLERTLSNQGRDDLLNNLRDYLRQTRERAEREFPVNGTQHPFHSDMIVTNTCFLHNNKKKAQKGKYKPYNDAAQVTAAAVEITAEQLEAKMKEALIPDEKTAEELMRGYLNQVGIGCIQALEDLPAVVGIEPGDQAPPRYLELPYDPQRSCSDRIDEYLRGTRDHIRYQCQREILDRFEQALETLRPDYNNQVEEKQRQLDTLRVRRAGMPDMNRFLERCLNDDPTLLKRHFNPIGGDYLSRTKKAMLYREQEDAEAVRRCWPDNDQYEISAQHGGLVQIDDAKLKCLHIFLATCTDAALCDLIR